MVEGCSWGRGVGYGQRVRAAADRPVTQPRRVIPGTDGKPPSPGDQNCGPRHHHEHRRDRRRLHRPIGVIVGETMSSGAFDVLVGQTAIWWGDFTGDVTVAQVKVTSSPKMASSVPAVAVITSQLPTFVPDAPGPVILLDGTVTNSGTTTGSFTIEFQMSSGQVGRTSVPDVPPGQTVPWRTYVFGTIPARILRITEA